MPRDDFKNLAFIDQTVFTELLAGWGYSQAACYRQLGKALVFLMGSAPPDEAAWPATIDPVNLHYTDSRHDLLPFGWYKTKRKTDFGRNAIFYAPEQEGQLIKILFVLFPRDTRRRVAGALDGALEAFSKRLIVQIDQSEMRQFFTESLIYEHASKLGQDTLKLLDHELRTPIAAIAGHAHLLADAEQTSATESGRVILEQVSSLLASVEKLSDTIGAAYKSEERDKEFEMIEVSQLVRQVANDVAVHAQSERPEKHLPDVRVVDALEGSDAFILGSRDRLYRAIWEVIHNGIIYSLNSQVQVSLYTKGESQIIDVKDGGIGVPKGSEDLIFLQFYKGQSDLKVRRGHRGLGLGLFLAKHITEQHAGQLLLVRQGEKGSLFRFLLPRCASTQVKDAI